MANQVERDDWDLRKGRPKQKSDRLLKLSLFLEAVKAKLFEIYLDIKLNNDELSAENIKNIYLGKGTHDYTILELTDQAIKRYEKELAPGSIKNYSATRAYIQTFCKVKYKSGDIKLKFLTCVFIDDSRHTF